MKTDTTKKIQEQAQKDIEDLLKLEPGDPEYRDYFKEV